MPTGDSPQKKMSSSQPHLTIQEDLWYRRFEISGYILLLGLKL